MAATATCALVDPVDLAALKIALQTLAPATTDKFGVIRTNGTKLVIFKVTT